MEFAYDGGGLGKGGTVWLYVDGVQVGEGRVEGTASGPGESRRPPHLAHCEGEVGEEWTPRLELHESAGRCRLSLNGECVGQGLTLQEAADDLVTRLLSLAIGFRTSGLRFTSEAALPNRDFLEFLWELGELAARGEDIRRRLFGAPSAPAPDG